MKKRATLFVAIVCGLLFSATTLSAQPGDGSGKNSESKIERQHRMWNNLDLTDDQKTKLKTLHDEMQQVRKKHFEAVKKVRDKIKDELLKDSPSQKKLHGYAGELGELHKQITKERSDHLLKVKKLLKPDQFQKLLEHEQRMGKGKFGHKGNCNGCPHKKGCGKGFGKGPKDGSGPGCQKGK